MSILSLRNISKRFDGVDAVHDVSLEIHSGEFFSILGPSGCGKTTLLRTIAGFELPTEGSIHLDGKDITGTSPRHRGIGMVFQNYALFPHMTVFQNVAFGLEAKSLGKGEIRARVEKILDSVQLAHKIDAPVPQLSGGEQQRVAVARALVVEPEVLLFDEPLSNLDVTLRASTRTEIRTLQKNIGITSVYVTHDQSEAMSLSDRIAVMKGGRIVQVGNPLEIYEHPCDVFVAEFLGSANIVHGTYDALSGTFQSGRLRIKMPAGVWQQSGNIILAIKPDAMILEQVSAGDAATLMGQVVEKEYLGFTTTINIDLSGIVLRVTALSSEFVPPLQKGMTVGARLDWSKITFLPDVA